MSSTEPRKITATERRKQAMELRRDGHTYAEIAARLGITPSSAHKAVSKALQAFADKQAQATAEHRELECIRLDALLRAVWDAAVGGDLEAVDTVLKIMVRRARLLGLDMPAKVAATSPNGEDEAAGAMAVVPMETPGIQEWLQKYRDPQAAADSEGENHEIH